MGKYISLGEINKSLLFIFLMSVSSVLYKYIYGFTYIECFYPMNIYRILYNWIIDKNKHDCPRHRVFDTFFSYIGVIIISFIFVKDKAENKTEKNEIIKEKDKPSARHGSVISVMLIYNKKKKIFAKVERPHLLYIYSFFMDCRREFSTHLRRYFSRS